MVRARKWVYNSTFEGYPTMDNFCIEGEILADIKENEFLAEAMFLSVDPYMRLYMPEYPLGSVMVGMQIAKVVESKNTKFPVGSYVHGSFGWRTHTVCNPDKRKSVDPNCIWHQPYILPDFGQLPISLGLGILGMPGTAAYFGFLEICQPKEGETVVVSGAAGAVGNLVGQIACIKGCNVIGITGSDIKCEWIKTMGCNHGINYRTGDIAKELKKAAPRGVDCYFDNVGGKVAEIVRGHMNCHGRISVCGASSCYNQEKAMVADPQLDFARKQLKQQGFHVSNWADRRLEGIQQILKWIEEDKLRYPESVTEGFENMPKAFIGMLKGEFFGKAIVKV